jgi:hypothetical protein
MDFSFDNKYFFEYFQLTIHNGMTKFVLNNIGFKVVQLMT